MNNKNSTIIYLRVSTAEQETDSLEHQVVEFCRNRDWSDPQVIRREVNGVRPFDVREAWRPSGPARVCRSEHRTV